MLINHFMPSSPFLHHLSLASLQHPSARSPAVSFVLLKCVLHNGSDHVALTSKLRAFSLLLGPRPLHDLEHTCLSASPSLVASSNLTCFLLPRALVHPSGLLEHSHPALHLHSLALSSNTTCIWSRSSVRPAPRVFPSRHLW